MEYLTTLIIVIAVSLLIKRMRNDAAKPPPVDGEGVMVLKYPAFIALIGYSVIAFGFLIGIITIFKLLETTGDEVVPFLVLFFVILGLPLVIMEKNIRVIVSEDKIVFTGFAKKKTEVRWNEVNEVYFSCTSRLVFRTGTRAVKLNTALAGMDSFIDLMKRKLEPSLYEKALKNMEKTLKKTG